MSARVAVIGAGVEGLTAAHELGKRGMETVVFERWPGLGGQAATLDVGDGVLLERYYHHLFMSDADIQSLYDELNIPGGIGWHDSSVAFFIDGKSRAFTTPLDLLRFSPLPPLSRLRLGLAVLNLQRRHHDVAPFEPITAKDWIVKAMGQPVWDSVMGPLLRGKFGARAEDISMSWLWSKLTIRREIKGEQAKGEKLGYPIGGFEPLFAALEDSIDGRGGTVAIDRPAARIERDGGGFAVTPAAAQSFRTGHDPRDFEPGGPPEHFDAVVATVPNPIFEQLLGPELREEVGADYLSRLDGIEYHAAQTLLLELDRGFTPFYWINVADRELPFVGLVEQGNLTGREPYGGRHFLYVANYVERDDPVLAFDADALLDRYEPGLRAINPGFERDWVLGRWLFSEPDAQPIVTPGYRQRMPPLETGAPGLVLANTTQIFPEDRGTNYAVRLGRQAAALVAGARAEPRRA